MKVRLISPFDDAEQIWIGLDEPGKRRKVFRFVSPDTGSEEFMAGSRSSNRVRRARTTFTPSRRRSTSC